MDTSKIGGDAVVLVVAVVAAEVVALVVVVVVVVVVVRFDEIYLSIALRISKTSPETS